MDDRKEFKMKVCLLGEPAVGKTSLANKYVINKFDDRYVSTLGNKVSKKNVDVDIDGTKARATLVIWDVLGQSQFKNVLASAMEGASGALIVCDLTRKDTFERIDDWIQRLWDSCSEVPIILLGNKSDLVSELEVTEGDMKERAGKYGCTFYTTSAKTGDHVDEAFMGIARYMVGHTLGLEVSDPAGSGIGDEEEVEDPADIFVLEDLIISGFCDVLGGQDFAMPIVRQQFKRIEMDFRDPNIEGIRALSENFYRVVQELKGDEEAEEMKRRFIELIARYESASK